MSSAMTFMNVGLLGFGPRNAEIAQTLATSGRTVVVLENGQDRATGRPTGVETADRITTTDNIADLRGVDLVIESLDDDLESTLKKLAAVADVVGERVPVVSTTPVFSITEIAAALPVPERVAGLRFPQSGTRTRTIEVVRGLQSADDVVDDLVTLVDSLPDREGIVVKDRPGSLVDALLIPYLNDVIAELDDGLASPEDIDVALELGLGYQVGPLRMLDAIGVDAHLRATEAVYAATGDVRYAPPPLLRRMVAAGRLGEKSGLGFRVRQHNN